MFHFTAGLDCEMHASAADTIACITCCAWMSIVSSCMAAALSFSLQMPLNLRQSAFDNLNFGGPSCPVNDCLSLMDITVGQCSLHRVLL